MKTITPGTIEAVMSLHDAIDRFIKTFYEQMRGRLETHSPQCPVRRHLETRLAELQRDVQQTTEWMEATDCGFTPEKNLVIMLARLEHIKNWMHTTITMLSRI